MCVHLFVFIYMSKLFVIYISNSVSSFNLLIIFVEHNSRPDILLVLEFHHLIYTELAYRFSGSSSVAL